MDRLAVLRAAARRKAPTPIGALVRGLAAGAIGAGVQSLFFLATRRWAPKPTEIAPDFARPEAEAKHESTVDTVARRTAHGLMQRGPIDEPAKKAAGAVVHYAFGAGWGGLYGLVRESTRISPAGFGALVWMTSTNLLLPAFRLAAWPNRYSLKEHHYALQAHFVYGLATAGSYALLRDVGPLPLGTIPAMVGIQALAWLQRTPPARLLRRAQPWPRRVFQGTLMQKAALA